MTLKSGIDVTKNTVKEHWEQEPCGSRYGTDSDRRTFFKQVETTRYRLDPYMPAFVDFASARGKRVLEIGVGLGTDFCNWVRHGAVATGIDLTQSAIDATRERLQLEGVDPARYDLRQADAEHLPFADHSFDIVYSWGVLHHSPDTGRCLQEAFRVLRSGGVLKGMLYHVPAWTGWMLWVGHCLLRGRPFVTVKRAIAEHLESPGTKAYTRDEVLAMLAGIGFTAIDIRSKLCSGDLLLIKPAKQYAHPLYRFIWRWYPRWLVRLLGDRFGFFLLIQAEKSS